MLCKNVNIGGVVVLDQIGDAVCARCQFERSRELWGA